jgi:RimJ/RimL family protein N-acetyltransferase
MDAVDPITAPLAAPITLIDAWPLFGLRIRSERLELRLPTDDELLDLLAVARAGIHPPDEMPFGVAWSTVPSPAFERAFFAHHWGMRAGFSATDWTLNLMATSEGRVVGAQTIHAVEFPIHRTVDTGSWIARADQGRGLGTEMRSAVLSLAFDGLGARAAESSAFLDNAASNAVSRALGYRENGRGALAPQGISRETQRFLMTLDDWRARPRPPVEIEGLDPCRSWFGA